MVDPTTTNRGYAVPTRGSDVGTWDTPLNGNWNLLDTNIGGITTVSLSNIAVTLNAGQAACGTIVLTGTLTGSVSVTFPSVQGWWSIDNQLAMGSFVCFLTTGAGAQICAPPGEVFDIQANGSSGMKFRNLGRVGTYIDYATASVPLWISACTVPPYLNCIGGSFSGSTYPGLVQVLGTTTLPDLRGRSRAYLNQGTGRINSGSGVDGNSIYSAGGLDQVVLVTAQIPAHAHVGTTGSENADHTHNIALNLTGGAGSFASGGSGPAAINGLATFTTAGVNSNHQHNFTTGFTGGDAAHTNMPPVQISGITMIRAA